VDVCLVIKRRLDELGFGAERSGDRRRSYRVLYFPAAYSEEIAPAPDRTDIYEKMAKFLKLPSDRLSKLADHQRREELKRNLGDPPAPLFREIRELILNKCAPDREKQVRAIFEKQPFGELERFVTQKLLDVIKECRKQD